MVGWRRREGDPQSERLMDQYIYRNELPLKKPEGAMIMYKGASWGWRE